MKISPLEIRQKTFEKAFRGLDKEDVNAFLLSLSHEWERMLDENKNLKDSKQNLEKEVQKLREIEATLFKTLKTAEDTGASVVDQAKTTAQLHMKETQISADAMLNDAKSRARAIIERADEKARIIIEDMNDEVKALEENYRIIENQRENVISQLKLLSEDVINNVQKISKRESGIEQHLKKVKLMLRESQESNQNNDGEEKEEVKKPVAKKILISEPIVREPIAKPIVEKPAVVQQKTHQNTEVKKTPVLPSESDDLSFFDQLDD